EEPRVERLPVRKHLLVVFGREDEDQSLPVLFEGGDVAMLAVQPAHHPKRILREIEQSALRDGERVADTGGVRRVVVSRGFGMRPHERISGSRRMGWRVVAFFGIRLNAKTAGSRVREAPARVPYRVT